MSTLIRVIKLGGSLLDIQDIGRRLDAWLAVNPAQVNLMVIGGGQIIEAVRELDRIHRFDAVEIHWRCIDLLATTARIASTLFANSAMIQSSSELERFLVSQVTPAGSMLAIVQVSSFYGPQDNSDFGPLPESWETTSDSIAALLAVRVGAEELVLMKSREPDQDCVNAHEWKNAGIVDEAFPRLADRIPRIRMVNLRTLASFGSLDNRSDGRRDFTR